MCVNMTTFYLVFAHYHDPHKEMSSQSLLASGAWAVLSIYFLCHYLVTLQAPSNQSGNIFIPPPWSELLLMLMECKCYILSYDSFTVQCLTAKLQNYSIAATSDVVFTSVHHRILPMLCILSADVCASCFGIGVHFSVFGVTHEKLLKAEVDLSAY